MFEETHGQVVVLVSFISSPHPPHCFVKTVSDDIKTLHDALLSYLSLQPFHTTLTSLRLAAQKLPVPGTNMLGVKLGQLGGGVEAPQHDFHQTQL